MVDREPPSRRRPGSLAVYIYYERVFVDSVKIIFRERHEEKESRPLHRRSVVSQEQEGRMGFCSSARELDDRRLGLRRRDDF